MVRGMWWQLSVKHGERLTHFLSVFSPSGRELIKKDSGFIYCQPLAHVYMCVCVCVCVCVSRTDFALSEAVLSHTSLVGPCHFAHIQPAAL